MLDSIKNMFGHSHNETTFNFNQITSNIYIGNNQCCHVGLDLMLQKEGIYADLSLEEEEVDKPLGVKSFLWLPIVDHTAPDKEQMTMGINFIDSIVKLDKKIYIHCKNGHGRGPTIVIAYFILKENKTFEEALNLVKKQRPSMHLDENQETFLRNLK